jgi:hypothetical protein
MRGRKAMKLVITRSRWNLLSYVDAGYVSIDDSGESVLEGPNIRSRKVTSEMDKLQTFGLVHATLVDRTYVLTERGAEIMKG